MTPEKQQSIVDMPWPKEAAPFGTPDKEKAAWRAEHPITVEGLEEIVRYNARVAAITAQHIRDDLDFLFSPHAIRLGFFHGKPTWRQRFIIWLFQMNTVPTSELMKQMGRPQAGDAAIQIRPNPHTR